MMQKHVKSTILFLFLTLLVAWPALSQKGAPLKHSEDMLMGMRQDGEMVNILVGNVVFTQPNTTINCDSAIFSRAKNALDAFGKVKIFDRVDSVTITSRKLTYDGNERLAKIRENVVYRKDSTVLYTEFLDYDMVDRSARYFNGGRVVDGETVLTSRNGFYDTEANTMIFTGKVVVKNPDYVLEAEDLLYDINTKIATINSPNTITRSDGTVLTAEIGSEFNTVRSTSLFFISEIESESYILKADTIFFDEALKYYRALRNVRMLGKEDEVIITGDEARYWKPTGITVVFGEPVMRKNDKGDTLYLSADTLVSIDHQLPENRRMLAFEHVKVFKTGLRGKADSLAYFFADSTIHFYNDPVLWNAESQITADSIYVTLKEGLIDKMYTRRNSYIISEDSIENYNQVKGRNMIAHFFENSLESVDVNGNGESLYFALEEETNILVGMNKIICSDMKIKLIENKVNSIISYTNPDGKFIPAHELLEKDTKLDAFSWRIDERPELWEILNISQEEFEMNYERPRLLRQQMMEAASEIPASEAEVDEEGRMEVEGRDELELGGDN